MIEPFNKMAVERLREERAGARRQFIERAGAAMRNVAAPDSDTRSFLRRHPVASAALGAAAGFLAANLMTPTRWRRGTGFMFSVARRVLSGERGE